MECSFKNRSRRKNISREKFVDTCCLCVNLRTVKILGQSDKFPMGFSFLQFPLQVKNIDSRKQRYIRQSDG